MASITDICNFALSFVGDERIMSVDDDTERARLCDLFYDQSRREVLEEHPWSRATKRVKIAEDSEAPESGYEHRYALPGDFLRAIYIKTDRRFVWAIEGDFLLTDEGSPIDLAYTFDLLEAGKFSPLMTQAISLKLAVNIVEKVTDSTSSKQFLVGEYERTLVKAKSQDGQRRSPVRIAPSTWLRESGRQGG